MRVSLFDLTQQVAVIWIGMIANIIPGLTSVSGYEGKSLVKLQASWQALRPS